MYRTEMDFVDNTGQPSKLLRVHQHVTISANGITLLERDNFTVIVSQDGTTRSVGLPTHIQGPGGIVLLDAGYLVQAADHSVIAVHGPHPQFCGATFCSPWSRRPVHLSSSAVMLAAGDDAVGEP